MAECYVLYNKKGGVVLSKSMSVESIEAFFGKPLLKVLYEEYLYEWSMNSYGRDETGTVQLALTKDRFDEADYLGLSVAFVIRFFDFEDPFLLTTHGKVGYNLFCRVLYKKWLDLHFLLKKGE